MSAFSQDLRQAIRRLARDPGFTAVVILTLAVGIGGNAAVFSIVERFTVRSLPFPESARLVRVRDTVVAPDGQVYRPQVLAPHWQAIADRARAFDRTAAIWPVELTFTGGEAAVSFQGADVSAGTLDLLGIRPRLGRLFSAEEERRGASSGAALVSHRFWQTRLGGRSDVLGAALPLSAGTATVVGVLPEGYQFPYSADVWRPLVVSPSDPRDFFVLARLAPGVPLDAARRELAALAVGAENAGPATLKGRGMVVSILRDDLVESERRVPLALMAGVGFLLVLACANLASLLLARSVARQREMGIRAALGATRARQVRQVLCESVLLAGAGGAVGLLLFAVSAAPLAALVPRALVEDVPFAPPGLSWSIAGFAFAVSLLTGVLFGLAPAWRASGTAAAALLGAAGRSSLPRGTRRLLAGFVVAEIALATALLSGGTLMVADFLGRQYGDLGLDPAHLYSMELPLASLRDDSPERRRALARQLVDAASAVPGVSSAAITTANPFSERRWGVRIALERAVDPGRELATVNLRLATPGLFSTLKTPVVEGRDVSERDRPDSPAVAVVSRHLARRLWGEGPAVGGRLVRRAPDGSLVGMTVAGVVGDVRDSGNLRDTLYIPYAQAASLEAAGTVYLVVRGAGAYDGWASEVGRATRRVEPRVGASEAGFLDALYARSLAGNRVGTSMLALFSGFGLLLATIGIFAVVSFVARERRTELAIRAALGATPGQVRGTVRRHGLGLATAGFLAGLPLALTAGRILAAALPDFAERRGLSAAVSVALLAVAAAASDLPARRAARADPLKALRTP